jgi:predicted transcriptional regulator
MSCKKPNCDSASKLVLKTLSDSDVPLGAKEIAEKTGIDPKDVSAALKELKADGLVHSPKQCKYAATGEVK